ncbi:MAG: hypothetical protein RIC06_00040 [Cyclobacteriaceae bacterium]
MRLKIRESNEGKVFFKQQKERQGGALSMACLPVQVCQGQTLEAENDNE